MTTPSTTGLDTELSAVNSILGAIGQSPVTTLGTVTNNTGTTELFNTFANPEIALIYNILKECNLDIQSEGWSFNTESHYKMTPDANGYITIGDNILHIDIHDEDKDRFTDVVKRDGRLYDKVDHTDVFTDDVYLDIVWLFKFTDMPQVFRRYVTYCASTRAATQLIANSDLAQLLGNKEAYARSICMEYECNQGDHSYLGWPHKSNYNSFVPYNALRR